jgi:hypothetical protein
MPLVLALPAFARQENRFAAILEVTPQALAFATPARLRPKPQEGSSNTFYLT